MSFYDLIGLPVMQFGLIMISLICLILTPLNLYIMVTEHSAKVRETCYMVSSFLLTVICTLVFVIFATNH